MSKEEIDKIILRNEKQMNTVAKDLDFFEAARLRDELSVLRKISKKNQIKKTGKNARL